MKKNHKRTKSRKKNKFVPYPLKQKKVCLNKKWFSIDLFWSIQNGREIDIDTLIAMHLRYSITYDIKKLIMLFSKQRVLRVAEIIKPECLRTYELNNRIINDRTFKTIRSEDFAPFYI